MCDDINIQLYMATKDQNNDQNYNTKYTQWKVKNKLLIIYTAIKEFIYIYIQSFFLNIYLWKKKYDDYIFNTSVHFAELYNRRLYCQSILTDDYIVKLSVHFSDTTTLLEHERCTKGHNYVIRQVNSYNTCI